MLQLLVVDVEINLGPTVYIIGEEKNLFAKRTTRLAWIRAKSVCHATDPEAIINGLRTYA